MPFAVPVAEQRFLLQHVAGIDALAAMPAFADATPDMVDAVLEGAAAFAEGSFAPLNRVGDTVGARRTEAGVTMPPGYVAAYHDYVAGGWGTIDADVAQGGQGLPFSVATAVLESLGTANLSFALCPTLTVGAIEATSAHGSASQQAMYLPKLVTGEWTGTMNLTEPQAGSDVGALRTTATPQADGTYRIKGTKIYISYGEHDLAENIVHLVLARTPGAPAGTRGISLFVVPRFRVGADGAIGAANDVRCVSIEHKMGLHASPTCVMSFGDRDDCIGEIVGPEHGGMRAMFTMMNNARLNVGLQGVEIAERATQAAVDYATVRVQSARAGAASRESVAIVEHPDVRRMLLRMKALTQGARALCYHAAGQVDRAHQGDAAARVRVDLMTPLVKAYGTDVGVEVSGIGIQVHGGMGFIEETGAAQHYRDARIAPIYEGTNGIQAADLVGRKLTGDGGAGLAALLAEIRGEAADEAGLMMLVDSVERVAEALRVGDGDDRLAGSYPFLTMLSVATAGWLMARQGRAAVGDDGFARMKRAVVRFYLDRLVPEATGLSAGALAGAAGLYAVGVEELVA
ncbi:acyl-CoA dehydrogenase [Sphingomonas prati]|uniref:3-methylmercaptopropionyl-CoA dehydrogenase n=2 Tax=Sphingomonas prati TaxID=1843237 RepID=A0A7W9F3I4_9SPHN|nr:alkylation response protein AidB-like acyl-CoA dehydrogenase [Sphingomonas prati]GGE76530.1 acyl-CoA dehydrogenase [Sphingomonas prati]